MITLTWGNLRDREFMLSLSKIFAQEMGVVQAASLAKAGFTLKKQQELCHAAHEALLKKCGTPDEKEPAKFNIKDENKMEYATSMMNMDKTEFTINAPKLDPSMLKSSMQLSPQDLMLLQPLFVSFEEPEMKASASEKTVAGLQ